MTFLKYILAFPDYLSSRIWTLFSSIDKEQPCSDKKFNLTQVHAEGYYFGFVFYSVLIFVLFVCFKV